MSAQENLYVVAREEVDSDGDMEVYTTYATDLNKAINQQKRYGGYIYRLVKHVESEDVALPVTQDGVWTVGLMDGGTCIESRVFRTELEAYHHAYKIRYDGWLIEVEFKPYTEGH